MHSHRIHIICRKGEIAGLITKSLTQMGYCVGSSYGDEMGLEILEEIDRNTECLIFDKDIDPELKFQAKIRFSNAKFICLPSLETPNSLMSDADYMSAPFRLSELTEFVNNMFHPGNK